MYDGLCRREGAGKGVSSAACCRPQYVDYRSAEMITQPSDSVRAEVMSAILLEQLVVLRAKFPNQRLEWAKHFLIHRWACGNARVGFEWLASILLPVQVRSSDLAPRVEAATVQHLELMESSQQGRRLSKESWRAEYGDAPDTAMRRQGWHTPGQANTKLAGQKWVWRWTESCVEAKGSLWIDRSGPRWPPSSATSTKLGSTPVWLLRKQRIRKQHSATRRLLQRKCEHRQGPPGAWCVAKEVYQVCWLLERRAIGVLLHGDRTDPRGVRGPDTSGCSRRQRPCHRLIAEDA